MKSKKKVFLTVLCAAALVVASVLGTMAFLTKTTQTVTNTFTAGNVDLTLDETVVNDDGTATTNPATRSPEGNGYKLIPGHKYTKDPIVHVTKDSEESWIFVKVTNGISDIEAATNPIAAQITANDWIQLKDKDGNDVTNVYYYKDKVAGGANGVDLPVFGEFTIAGDATVGNYTDATVKVMAYAVQADGFPSSADAWASAPSTWNNN